MTPKPLSSYAGNVTSQFGEDGIIAEILARIGARNRTCVEFGAWDGKYLSNTWDLWRNQGWRAILIEGDLEKHRALKEGTGGFPAVAAVHAFVAAAGADSLDSILARVDAPTDPDLLSIDIDGDEYYVWRSLTRFRPRIVVVEYNPTIPSEIDLVQTPGKYFGASARALCRLANEKRYGLAACTETNCIFVDRTDFASLGMQEHALDEIFPRGNLTYIVNSYDGGTFMTRNPTYSGPVPTLSFDVLVEELRLVLSRNRAERVTMPVPEGSLTPVRIMAVPLDAREDSLLKRSWLRVWNVLSQVPPLPRFTSLRARWAAWRAEQKILADWKAAGRPVPPPLLVKQRVLRAYARRHRTRVLLETGTYLGDTVDAMRHRFDRVISVELSPELYRKAIERFAGCPNVEIVQGDSAAVLPDVLSRIDEPVLFWLDGHFSEGITAKGDKDTPILSEVDAIFRHRVKRHVVLVDDARCFDGNADYPTLAGLEKYVRERRPDASFVVKDDIIRIV